jgi:hypothetical protein
MKAPGPPASGDPCERWIRRLRRGLGASGTLRQLAVLLAGEDGCRPDHWERRLRRIVDDRLPPDPETLLRIESHLARSESSSDAEHSVQLRLF